MKPIEISNDLFCGRTDFCDAAISNGCEGLSCGECHRKWPTPEQFKEEYGEEYPDDGAIYFVEDDFYRDEISWKAGTYKDDFSSAYIVCACTPFGNPPADWRPQ